MGDVYHKYSNSESPAVEDRLQISLLLLSEFNPLQPVVAFLYSLKTSENL